MLQAFVRESDELVHIKVDGQDITTTPEHPFWVPQQGWTDAIELRAGDILLLSNGEYVIIEAVQHEILEAPITVYNFEVEDFHTYYVTGLSILVHNDCWDITRGTRVYYKGQTYYYDGYGYYWQKDTAGHGYNGASAYKVYVKINGKMVLKWDADINGNFITGKHSSNMGRKF